MRLLGHPENSMFVQESGFKTVVLCCVGFLQPAPCGRWLVAVFLEEIHPFVL